MDRISPRNGRGAVPPANVPRLRGIKVERRPLGTSAGHGADCHDQSSVSHDHLAEILTVQVIHL